MEIQAEVSARAFAQLENRAATMDNADPLGQLRHAIQSYFDFGLRDPQAYCIALMLEHPKTGQSADWDIQDFIALDHPGPRAPTFLGPTATI